jgi:hypothetical protein
MVRLGVILHEHRPNSEHQLSQLLFYENGTMYDQSLILDANYEVDPTLLAEQGLPYYASSWVIYLLSMNLGLGATITHLLLWNHDDLCGAWQWMRPSNLRKQWQDFRLRNVNWKFWQNDGVREQPKNTKELDPHYVQMLKVSFSVSANPINERLTITTPQVPRRPRQLVLRHFCPVLHRGFDRHLQERLHVALVGFRHRRYFVDCVHSLPRRVVRYHGYFAFDA